MNFNPRHFLRMAKWARHPPGDTRVKLVLGVVLVCLVLFGIDRIWGWPAWLNLADGPNGRLTR